MHCTKISCIGNLRCIRRCRVRCKRDHSIANNVMQQKGSFSMPGKAQIGIRKILSAGDARPWWGWRECTAKVMRYLRLPCLSVVCFRSSFLAWCVFCISIAPRIVLQRVHCSLRYRKIIHLDGGAVVQRVRHIGLAISRSRVQILLEATLRNNLRQVVYTYMRLSSSSITWYRPKRGDALRLER